MRKDIIRTRRRRDTAPFEMIDPMETCDGTTNGPILPDIKSENMPEYDKHPYKMMLNISRDHPFVLANEDHHTHVHHLGHYGQHGCADMHHIGQHTDETLSSNQLINTGQIDANNGYYCSFF